MTPGFLGRAFSILAWGAVLMATLSIANWPGDWGHGVCGPWGCGPPLQALWACHLSWLVVLIPATFVLRQWLSPVATRHWGAVLIGVSLIIVVGTILHERLDWWVAASEYQRRFFWRRVGFSLVTRIEAPAFEVLLAGIVLRWTYLRLAATSNHSNETSPQSDRPVTTAHF